MTVTVEVVAGRGLWGIFEEGDRHFRVDAPSWTPVWLLRGIWDIVRMTDDPDFQAVEGVEFDTRDEAIEYIREKCREAWEADVVYEITDEDLEKLASLANNPQLERVVANPGNYDPRAVEIAREELKRRLGYHGE